MYDNYDHIHCTYNVLPEITAAACNLSLSLSQYVTKWKKEHAGEIWCENVRTKEKKKLWRRKDVTEPFPYPWKEMK